MREEGFVYTQASAVVIFPAHMRCACLTKGSGLTKSCVELTVAVLGGSHPLAIADGVHPCPLVILAEESGAVPRTVPGGACAPIVLFPPHTHTCAHTQHIQIEAPAHARRTSAAPTDSASLRGKSTHNSAVVASNSWGSTSVWVSGVMRRFNLRVLYAGCTRGVQVLLSFQQGCSRGDREVSKSLKIMW